MKFSIITATYNCESYIPTCINSISNQSYSNVENIIVDGDSDDDTLDIIKSLHEKDSKIISEPDSGIYDALNKGIRISQGDIICFLHADDMYESNDVIEHINSIFEKSDVEAVFGNLFYVDPYDTNIIIRAWKSKPFNYSSLRFGWMPPHPALFVKKEIYEKYGYFNTKYKISADYDLMVRLFGKHKINAVYTNKFIIRMRYGGASNNYKNLITKWKEDYHIIKSNGIGGLDTLFFKNFLKIGQFFR